MDPAEISHQASAAAGRHHQVRPWSGQPRRRATAQRGRTQGRVRREWPAACRCAAWRVLASGPLTASTSGRWQRPSRPRATWCACRSAGAARPAAAGQGLSTMSRRRWTGCRPWSQPLRRAPTTPGGYYSLAIPQAPIWPSGRRGGTCYRVMCPGARTRGRGIAGVAALAPVRDLVACHRQRLGGGAALICSGAGPSSIRNATPWPTRPA
jgi:hypothetical protein